MAENVQDATAEILKRLQESIPDFRKSTETSIATLRQEMNQHFETLAAEAHRDRRNINGLMAPLQAASGDFDERIRELGRVSLLEDRAS